MTPTVALTLSHMATGKTATVHLILSQLRREQGRTVPPFVLVEINGLRLTNPYQVRFRERRV